ncbi:hypothetical protein DPMN_025177 [Dreissena polymorpha]|uniref:Uncharacterized protein n=1 Tax=Dreissena polymorpha TaxID=45954 RepID=A0A9D4LSU0_DREPO|nr:hypothetical protein DPMN_025177 [Dreissena polymorpha]
MTQHFHLFSAPHTLTLAPSEAAITWLNTSVTQATVTYDFDGLCNVTVTSATNDLSLQLMTSDTQVNVTIIATAPIKFGTYQITLDSSIGLRTFSGLTRDVFVGEEVTDFQVSEHLVCVFIRVFMCARHV